MEIKLKHQKIIIDHISVQAHVGVTEAERASLQETQWRVEISLDPNQTCVKDENIICYDQITKTIVSFSVSKPFKLIENMALECFDILKKDFPLILKLKLQLKKVHPPIKEIKGGVVFECEG